MPLNFEFLLFEEFLLNPFKFEDIKKEFTDLYKKDGEEQNKMIRITE